LYINTKHNSISISFSILFFLSPLSLSLLSRDSNHTLPTRIFLVCFLFWKILCSIPTNYKNLKDVARSLYKYYILLLIGTIKKQIFHSHNKSNELVLEGKWVFSLGTFIILELFGGNINFLQLSWTIKLLNCPWKQKQTINYGLGAILIFQFLKHNVVTLLSLTLKYSKLDHNGLFVISWWFFHDNYFVIGAMPCFDK